MSVPDFCPVCGAYWPCEHAAPAAQEWQPATYEERDGTWYVSENVRQAIERAGARYAQGIARAGGKP